MTPKEWRAYTRVGHLDNLETLRAVFYDHAYSRHYHDGYAVGVILKGSETYDCNKKTNVAPKGSIVIVNPGEIHDGCASNRELGWGYFMIYPHLSLIRTALNQLGLDDNRLPVFPETVFRDPEFAAGLIRFMDAFDAGDPEMKLEAVFLELLHLMISRHAEFPRTAESGTTVLDTPEKRKVAQVTEMVRENFADPLSLEDLATEVGLSSWALLRLFKKQTGISPYLLQTRLKISHAKEALREGVSPADTAALCGFADQSHMTKQFRRWMGVTPGDVAAGYSTYRDTMSA
ncbi:MAG: AraC family transcriptional regulator [Desulfobacterales bacterium]|nr:AraC family transcriptional regulator [Desulfobacterales bacterium]